MSPVATCLVANTEEPERYNITHNFQIRSRLPKQLVPS